ncbi:MAG: Flp pilus assembly complex ATPase component TadA, partial [Clostridiales bacterium]|nr:Flp pilus assembly complex ATPase component TadA [Clostridiales bacterium]
MEAYEILEQAVKLEASDILLITGLPVSLKLNGQIIREETDRLMPETSFKLMESIYSMAGDRDMKTLIEQGDDDFSFSLPQLSRFRVNAFKQRGSLAAVIRVVSFDMPSNDVLHIPDAVMAFAQFTKGMVLVTGPAGSGKSTTLACLINAINQERSA